MKFKSKDIVLVLVGLLLAVVGVVLLRWMPDAWSSPLPYVCLGVGAGAFGQGSGALLKRRALKGDPSLEKRLEIEAGDERNVALANRAKARAFDCMLYIFGALMLVYGLMGADLVFLLLLVGAYLLVVGISVYYYVRFDKEM